MTARGPATEPAGGPVLRQCATRPRKVGADVARIPGYVRSKHEALADTIAEPGVPRVGGELRMMACHYSREGADRVCVGWLSHQLGPGNNIALRLRVSRDPRLQRFATEGPQHARFEDTLPAAQRPRGRGRPP